MHSIDLIEKKLSELKPLNYNRFFWWRRWTTKTQPLHKYSPLWDKIKNGDYDPSPYQWQVHYCDWEINQKYEKYRGDGQRQVEETRVDKERRRRLRDDHEKYEKENLTQLRNDFILTFRMTKEDYEKDVVEVGGTLEEFYIYCEEKYGKWNRPSTMPRRGRPPKK